MSAMTAIAKTNCQRSFSGIYAVLHSGAFIDHPIPDPVIRVHQR